MALSNIESSYFLLSLAMLVGTARALGDLSRRLGQPALVGELAAGVLLGPTVLGYLYPDFVNQVFPASGSLHSAQDGLIRVSLLMFLLMAGLEADLSIIWKRAHHAFVISVGSILPPFAAGYLVSSLAPDLLGLPDGVSPNLFALVFGVAMFISAVPVIARTLMDLGIYKSDFGMLTMAVAVVNDIVGWFIFASILGVSGIGPQRSGWQDSILALIIGFLAITFGRRLVHFVLDSMVRKGTGNATMLSFILTLAFLGGACAEWVGVHALFGAFLVGTVVGASESLPQKIRTMLERFVSAFFAPLFFASIGLRVNFLTNFDLILILIVLSIASAGTIGGTVISARCTGMDRKTSLGLGFALNSRGAMEIVLGTLALQHGIIQKNLFVALVVMALLTSILSGPAMKRILNSDDLTRNG